MPIIKLSVTDLDNRGHDIIANWILIVLMPTYTNELINLNGIHTHTHTYTVPRFYIIQVGQVVSSISI